MPDHPLHQPVLRKEFDDRRGDYLLLPWWSTGRGERRHDAAVYSSG